MRWIITAVPVVAFTFACTPLKPDDQPDGSAIMDASGAGADADARSGPFAFVTVNAPCLRDVAVDSKGVIWGIACQADNLGNNLVRNAPPDALFRYMPGGFAHVAVTAPGTLYLTDASGHVLRFDEATGRAEPFGPPAFVDASAIAAESTATPGSDIVWVVGRTLVDVGGSSIYGWDANAGSWQRIPNSLAARVSIDTSGRVWVSNAVGDPNATGKIFYADGFSGFTEFAAPPQFCATDLAAGDIGGFGALWATSCTHPDVTAADYSVVQAPSRYDTQWTQLSAAAVRVVAQHKAGNARFPNGVPWLLDHNGALYRPADG